MFWSQLVNGELLKKKKEEGYSVLVHIDAPRCSFRNTSRNRDLSPGGTLTDTKNEDEYEDELSPKKPFDVNLHVPSIIMRHPSSPFYNNSTSKTSGSMEQMTPIRSNQSRNMNENAIHRTSIHGNQIHTIPEVEQDGFSPADLWLPELQRKHSEKLSLSSSCPPSISPFPSLADSPFPERNKFSSMTMTRTQSKEKKIGIGIGLDRVHDLIRNAGSYDEEQDDEYSVGSNHTAAEIYETLKMVIRKKDGVVSFLDDNKCLGQGGREGNHSDRSHVRKKERGADANETALDSPGRAGDEESTDTKQNVIFELIPTKNQTHKERKQKLYHQTRKACLEAAAEAYKIANFDVPDMILAQINDHRTLLFGNHLVFGNSTKSIKDSNARQDVHENSANATHIKLHKNDEIHVAPCQCALRLLGMKERKKPIDFKDGFDVADHTLQRLGLGLGIANADSTEEDAHNYGTGDGTEKGKQRQFKHSRTASTLDGRELELDFQGIDKEVLLREKGTAALARTSLAHVTSSSDDNRGVDDAPANDNSKGVSFSKETVNDKKGGPKRHVQSRSESNLFTGLGYHEMTLICNQGSEMTDSQNNEDGRQFVKWDAITIRCSSHDELDILVKGLRDSSKAKVVPFSSNPKERLKQLRAERQSKEKQEQTERISNSDGGRAVEGEMRESHASKDKTSLNDPLIVPLSQQSMDGGAAPSVTSPEQHKNVSQKAKEKRKPWDLNFNKKEYCEICDLTFTLLTRRHHCRKCERSCCGHCSRLLIEKGCDERRYCNRCASDILQKQSAALRGRSRDKSHVTTLPGKVHEACKTLGVGVVGRLPHWKTFLQPQLEDRPAVGRLTVEVIEALALPSVDLVNGKVDPYVRATITGYDRDMKWTLRQWLHVNRYSISSRFCSATLCPQWRGTGRKGGELLTLPVISTAGAVLRLEVLHYNILTNSRGKDQVLGVVEIPLSDLPNANLRRPDGVEIDTVDGKRRSMTFDGYCDRWYRLIPSDLLDSKSIVLSKPIVSPELRTSNGSSRKVGMQSLEELGKRIQALSIAPVEWFASAIKLDLPARRPEAICQEHIERSMIHVQIKLNASICGDVLSHAWFPPVRPRPIPPPYDPEILLSRILHVGKQTEPYRKIIQYIDFCIKWKHPPKVCIRAYIIFALHLAIFPHLLPLFHLYLIIFLARQLRTMQLECNGDELQSLHRIESFDDIGKADISQKNETQENLREDDDDENSGMQDDRDPGHLISSSVSADDGAAMQQSSKEQNSGHDFHSSPSLKELRRQKQRGINPGLVLSESSSNTSLINAGDPKNNETPEGEEGTKLNVAILWIAKRFGDNKGLEVLQFKLGMLGRDLRNLNSVWNGNNPLLTRAAMLYLVISCLLHFLMRQRLLWLLGTSTWYFAQAPFCVLTARFVFGFWRGIAKVMRRQQLLDSDILSNI